jgi:hypothetical protein
MREFSVAIKAGERNRDTTTLVRNWCAHARVEKFGGTGFVEMQPGLPIGHHSMRCNFPPKGGFGELGQAPFPVSDGLIVVPVQTGTSPVYVVTCQLQGGHAPPSELSR